MSETKKNYKSVGWRYYNPVQVLAGVDLLPQLKQLIPSHGILLLTTNGFTRRGTTEHIVGAIGKDRVIVHDKVDAYPEIDYIDRLTQQFKRLKVNALVAIGGGSVIDTAKVLSVTLPCSVENPLNATLRENQAQLWRRRIPVIAIPTTSGTGAEVTPFATIWDPKVFKKHSLSNELLYPAYALLDPNLTYTLPLKETLYTGLDAISHALESLWNKNRTPISASFAKQSLIYAVESLSKTIKMPEHRFHRSQMQVSSLLAGMAISQTRTAIAHSISYPLTSYFQVPHGLACGFTLKTIAEKMLTEQMLEHRDIVVSIITLLDEFDLANEIKRYLDVDDGVKLAPLMYNPDRADNFIRPIGEDEILAILKASFNVN
jgi:alcohol dehydrogenase